MNLPTSNNLPIQKLASVFGSTVATYKYYWLIAIIELVEEGNSVILKKNIFSRMISNAWYTINYFKLSFGKSDNLQIAVKSILNSEKLHEDENKINLIDRLQNSNLKETINQLLHFDNNVPHWFLSPWFPKKSKTEIYKLSKTFNNDCLYALHNDFIEINPLWIEYLKSNTKIIKDFCYWNLTLFLQTRNPSVPDIANKLIKPATRNGLSKQTKDYWKLVFEKENGIECIFTGKKLIFDEKNFALDHFIPHNFVMHDLIWNLVPIEKKFNSSKSDKLPLFEKHFEKFYKLQKTAFEINKQNDCKSIYMDEYLAIFPNLDAFDKEKFSNTIQPLITIASNNGFLFMNE